jgi:hypothetical protein
VTAVSINFCAPLDRAFVRSDEARFLGIRQDLDLDVPRASTSFSR